MIAPDNLIQRFRGVALERLGRVEAAWARVLGALDDGAAALIQREIHSLRGESCLFGFTEVNLICGKLEDLFATARGRGFAVDDDFDLAVHMALRFTAMLVRNKLGPPLAGIDLPGFVREIDRVLAEAGGGAAGTRHAAGAHRRASPAERVPAALRPRLSAIAIDAFVEYAAAEGARRSRLRRSWHAARDLVGVHRAVIGAGQLVKHRTGVKALARQLGKQVELAFEIASAAVTTEVLSILDAATLHLVRNAVAHGIEPPASRLAAGKPAAGKIVIRGGPRGELFELSVSDDGAGIALAQVQRRAVELGLIRAGERPIGAERWIEILCHPALSTRSETAAVSGRATGLHAVRDAVADAGGRIAITSQPGSGTTCAIELPVVPTVLDGHMFRAPGVPMPIVVEASWELAGPGPTPGPVIDLAVVYGLRPRGAQPTSSIRLIRGDTAVAIASDHAPVRVQARKVVATPAGIAEVVAVDGIEALLVRPQRLLATRADAAS